MTMENSPIESEITMDDVRNLIKKKDSIEEKIKAYYEVLEDVSLTFRMIYGGSATLQQIITVGLNLSHLYSFLTATCRDGRFFS